MYVVTNGTIYILDLMVFLHFSFLCGKGLNDHQGALQKGRGKLRVEVILVILCLSVCPSFTKIIKYLKQPLSLCSIYSLVQPHGDSMGPDATVHKDHFPIV